MPAPFPYQVAEGDREMSETAIRRLTRRPDEGKLSGVCAGMCRIAIVGINHMA